MATFGSAVAQTQGHPIEGIGHAFVAHRDALKELTGAIAQHEQAMMKMMRKCS